jgi:hypothetical protein
MLHLVSQPVVLQTRSCTPVPTFLCAGLLVQVLKAAMDLGMQPSVVTLRALLACCADLESRPGKTPLGLAAGPGFNLCGVGYVDLGCVLQACRDALQDQPLQSEDPAAGAVSAENAPGSSSSSSSGGGGGSLEARRVAAQLLRTWVFESTFGFVEGVRTHGPAYAAAGSADSSAAQPADEAQAAVGF